MDGQKAVRFYFELNKQKEILSVDVGVNDCNKNSNDLKKNWCNKNIGAGSCFLILVLGIGAFSFFRYGYC